MKISVIIPAFNESGNIIPLVTRLNEVLNEYPDRQILFIDDGSTDNSLQILHQLHQQDNRIGYISFSRNFGHQHALRCGIDYADGDCVISMDGDLQHPPELIPEMIKKWQEGYDIVYTQRTEEEGIGVFKKMTSALFYKLMNYLSDVTLEPGTADFRLLDARVANVIRNSHEQGLFVRGFISWMGFRQYKITYRAAPRYSGSTKYSIRKMLSFALNGITSFSIKPLRFSIIAGALISALAFVYAMYAVMLYLFYPEKAVPGWASVLVSVLFIGGIQLLFLGVLGEYLGKLFMQAKQRPGYIIKESSIHAKS
jgi:dolichol-phosphate mannosyltransferase